MRALVCTQLGDPLSGDAEKKPLQLKDDVPSPPLKDSSVRIKVQAAALNFADALQLQVTAQACLCMPVVALHAPVLKTLARRLPLMKRTLTVQGQYQDKPKLPFIPGSEVSGTVIEVGSRVKSHKVGDKVSLSRLTLHACQHPGFDRHGATLRGCRCVDMCWAKTGVCSDARRRIR